MDWKNVGKETAIALKGPVIMNLFVCMIIFFSIMQFYETNNYLFLAIIFISVILLYFTSMKLFQIQNESDNNDIEIEDLKDSIDSLSLKNYDIINEKQDLQAKYNMCLIQKDVNNSKLSLSEIELKDIKSKFENLQLQYDSCMSHKNDAFEKLDSLGESYQRLQYEIDNLESQLNISKINYEDLQNENVKLKEDLKTSGNIYDNNLKKLSDDYDVIIKEKDLLNENYSVIQKEKSDLEQEKEDLLKKIEQEKEDLYSLAELYKNLQDKLREYAKDSALFHSENGLLKTKYETLHKLFDECNDQREKLNIMLQSSEELMKIKDDLLKRILTVTKPNIKTRPILDEIKKLLLI